MFSEILRRARTYAALAQDDKGESARSAFSPVTLSGAASGNASREVERVSCARPSVISTEQREWRNLARQRINYERLVL